MLIVETSPADTKGLLQVLRSQGFSAVSTVVGTPEATRTALGTTDYNVSSVAVPSLQCWPSRRSRAPARPSSSFLRRSIDLNFAVGLIRLGPAIERELRDAELRRRQHDTENRFHESCVLFRAIVENVGDLQQSGLRGAVPRGQQLLRRDPCRGPRTYP
ncbi:MAG: hypothetical protein KF834_01825 [Burkholderiales bacterium]|nr:hypothetical protein [Burkholderiales bacterium]